MTYDEQLNEAKRIVKEADELIKKEPKRQPTFAESCKSAYGFWQEWWLECKADKHIFYWQVIFIGFLVTLYHVLRFLGVK